MEPDFDDEELRAERDRLQKMAALCRRHGYADGRAAADAQLRAVTAELDSRRKQD